MVGPTMPTPWLLGGACGPARARSRASAAVLLRPAHPRGAGLVEPPVPGLALVEVSDLTRHVLLEPGADLLAERNVLGGVVEIHGGGLLGWARPVLGCRAAVPRF